MGEASEVGVGVSTSFDLLSRCLCGRTKQTCIGDVKSSYLRDRYKITLDGGLWGCRVAG